MKPIQRALITLAAVFLLGIFVGAGLGYLGGRGEPAPSPSEPVAPVTPSPEPEVSPDEFHIRPFSDPFDDIISMTYRAEGFLLTAQRSKPGARFVAQITYADDRESQQCPASGLLSAQLENLARIGVKQTLQAEEIERRFPERLGTLEIRDSLAATPPAPMVFRAAADKTAIAVTTGDFIAEVDLPAETFARLESGCAAPAKR
jgi:hypothetical protein